MRFRKSLITGLLATSLTLGGGIAAAQDSTPVTGTDMATPEAGALVVPLTSADNVVIGHAEFTETDDGVMISIMSTDDSTLAPGEHGIHLHETGVCETTGETPFDSAGGHFNPDGEMHGDLNADPSHAGDLGNLNVEEDGSFSAEITNHNITLEPGMMNSLADEDGTALVVHAHEDDLTTDPSGESGDREACGVVFEPTDVMATPMATPET